jgi:hypothetical protein
VVDILGLHSAIIASIGLDYVRLLLSINMIPNKDFSTLKVFNISQPEPILRYENIITDKKTPNDIPKRV